MRVDQTDLPDWEKEAVCEAFQVELGFGTRYIEIPSLEPREAYENMREFNTTVRNRHVRARLEHAIEGRDAFRASKRS